MIRRYPKKFIYLVVSVVAVMILIMVMVDVLVVSPQRKAIKAVEDDIKILKKKIEDPEAESDEIEKLRQQLSAVCETLNKYVVSPERTSSFSVDIEDIARQAGLEEIRITSARNPSEINECKQVREGRIQMNFKSSFPKFAKFVNLLERSQPVIFVDYFKINRSGENSNLNDVDIVLTYFAGQDNFQNAMEIDNFINSGQSLLAESNLKYLPD